MLLVQLHELLLIKKMMDLPFVKILLSLSGWKIHFKKVLWLSAGRYPCPPRKPSGTAAFRLPFFLSFKENDGPTICEDFTLIHFKKILWYSRWVPFSTERSSILISRAPSCLEFLIYPHVMYYCLNFINNQVELQQNG